MLPTLLFELSKSLQMWGLKEYLTLFCVGGTWNIYTRMMIINVPLRLLAHPDHCKLSEWIKKSVFSQIPPLKNWTFFEKSFLKMKSNVTDVKNEFQASNEFGESSEDTSGFFESSSTLNNEKLYKASAPEQFTTNTNSRLRSRMKMQQVGDCLLQSLLLVTF